MLEKMAEIAYKLPPLPKDFILIINDYQYIKIDLYWNFWFGS